MTKFKAVVDTNILISAMMNGRSVSAEALNYVMDNFVFLASFETWSELEQKIYSKKFDKFWNDKARAIFLLNLATRAEFIEVSSNNIDCRDIDDNKFINLAIDGKAHLIISGDKDLRVLNPYKNIPILSPSEFLEKIKFIKV